MKARILNRWDMELPEASAEPWFLDWVLRSPKQAGQHLEVSRRTFEAIRRFYGPEDITAVKEYFGGIGAHALMLQDLFEPTDHAVTDFSLEAVEHMQRALPGDVRVWQADAYDSDTPWPVDIAVLDFGDLTVWKAEPGTARGTLMDKVFHMNPMAVTITDIAARYLHLQKGSYEPLLGAGSCDSYETYLEAFSRRLEDLYGYVMLEGNYTRWSTVMAFVPEDMTFHGKFHKLPASYDKGLVLV